MPKYTKGNWAIFAISILNVRVYMLRFTLVFEQHVLMLRTHLSQLFLYAFIKYFYKGLNKRRDVIWNKMTQVEKSEYIRTTTDEGNERLDFRFLH